MDIKNATDLLLAGTFGATSLLMVATIICFNRTIKHYGLNRVWNTKVFIRHCYIHSLTIFFTAAALYIMIKY
jgi:hypothetical protein